MAPKVECEYRTDQDELIASGLEDAEFKDSNKEASDTDTEKYQGGTIQQYIHQYISKYIKTLTGTAG